VLKLSAVVKSFGGRRVLDRFDLDVAAGESVGLLGANGCGKTTALRCIVGLARPESGRIEVGGLDIARDPIAARRRLSYLPQHSTFPATLTVRETLAVVARLRGVRGESVDREIAWCRLEGLADRNVARLSGGERQRLAIAVAFLPAVDLYLLDEPSASLDPAASRLLFQRVARVKAEGRTLLFTTHLRADIEHLATRTVFLRDGRLDSTIEHDQPAGARLFARHVWDEDNQDDPTPTHADCTAASFGGMK